MNKTQLDKTLGTIKNYVDTTKMNYLKYGSIDVNTLKTTGIYSLSSNCTNNATTNAGTMIVDFNVGTPYQLWIPDNNHAFYKRNWNKTDSVWGSWSNTYTGSITGNAATASKATQLTTARKIKLTGDVSGEASFNGTADASITATVGDDTHEHTHVKSRGRVTAESGTTYPAQKGLSMSEGYSNGYSTSYGNVLTMYGSGVSQLYIGWSGTSGAHEKAYIRSKRDTNDAAYSGWAQIYTSAHPQPSVTGSSGSCTGNAATATKLATARTINGTSFDGSANITTANWGTTRKLNRTSVNGSADVSIPLDYITCGVSNDNTNNYHLILESGKCTGDYTDKSIVIMVCNHYNNNSFGIAKATLRTNNASEGGAAAGELIWIVRSGFAANVLCYNIRNTAKDTYMDVFYKSSGTYNSATIYILGEGSRGNQSSQWTKNNTNATGTKAYTETAMKALRSYTSTLVSAVDAGVVNKANQLVTSRKIKLTGDVTGEASFNGSADATITATVADNSHSHNNYLPLAGGTLTGDTTFNNYLKLNAWSGHGSGTANFWYDGTNKTVEIETATNLKLAGTKVSKEGHTHSAYLPKEGGTLTGATTFNDYLKLNAWSGYGSGTANIWYDGTNKTVEIETATDLKLNGTKVSKSGHTHNYAGSSSAGGTANSAARVDLSRVSGSSNSANYVPGANRLVVREYGSDCSNMPSAHYYHIYTGQGSDASYNTQLAVGMTTSALYYRNRNNGTWGSWTKVATSGHNHDSTYLKLSGGTLTGETTFNNYLKLNAWSGYGSGTADFWYDGTNKTIEIETATDLKLNGTKVSKSGHNHDSTYLKLSGGTVTGTTTFSGTLNLTGNVNLGGTGGNLYFANNKGIALKNTGGTDRWVLYMDQSNRVLVGDTNQATRLQGSSITLAGTSALILDSNNTSCKVGYDSSTGDGYLSNKNGNWLRMRADGTGSISGKQIVTFASSNPDHTQIRYGSNLSGDAGFITFTW